MQDHHPVAERSKAVVRRFIEEVQNQKNWDAYDELNAPGFVNLSAPPGLPNDLEGGKMFLGAFLNAFPDGHVTIDDMIAEGDRVVTKKTFAAPHGRVHGDRADREAGGAPIRRHPPLARRSHHRALVEHGPAQLPATARRGPVRTVRRPEEELLTGSRSDVRQTGRERWNIYATPAPIRSHGCASPTRTSSRARSRSSCSRRRFPLQGLETFAGRGQALPSRHLVSDNLSASRPTEGAVVCGAGSD